MVNLELNKLELNNLELRNLELRNLECNKPRKAKKPRKAEKPRIFEGLLVGFEVRVLMRRLGLGLMMMMMVIYKLNSIYTFRKLDSYYKK